uniref:Uncharacterized protein n=1 Tax=Haemonchus contortus TaxID=6289 RepID=A0A7I4YTD5_HAECO
MDSRYTSRMPMCDSVLLSSQMNLVASNRAGEMKGFVDVVECRSGTTRV